MKGERVYKVGIIGPESTGKSILARYLAKRYDGIYVPEYARDYVERKQVESEAWSVERISWDELCAIACHQIEELINLSGTASSGLSAERSISEAVYQAQPVFFDTELIVTKVWFDYAFGQVPEWLNEAIRSYPMDVYLLTYPDIPWIPDPARSNGSDAIRLELFRRYESEIQALDIPYYIIRHTSD